MNECCWGMEASLDTNGAGISTKVVKRWYNVSGSDDLKAVEGR